jgi:hypothetical protein
MAFPVSGESAGGDNDTHFASRKGQDSGAMMEEKRYLEALS